MPEVPFHLSVKIGEAKFSASGDTDRVMAAFKMFEALLAAGDPPPPAKEKVVPGAKKAKPDGGKTEAPTVEVTTNEMTPLPVFLKDHEAKSNQLVATGILVWAEDHEGKTALTVPQITELWRKTNVKEPKNPSRDMRDAEKKGWVHRGTKGYSATGYGRKALAPPSADDK